MSAGMCFQITDVWLDGKPTIVVICDKGRKYVHVWSGFGNLFIYAQAVFIFMVRYDFAEA